MDLVATSIFCSMGRIIIQADDFLPSITRFGEIASMMLKRKFYVRTKRKIAMFSAEAPYQGASRAIDFIDRIGVTSRDEVRTSCILVN